MQDLETLQWLDVRGYLKEMDVAAKLLGILKSDRPVDLNIVRFLVDRAPSLPPSAKLFTLLHAGACQSKLESVMDLLISSRLCDAIRDRFTWPATRPKVLQWDASFMNSRMLGMMPIPGSLSYYASHYCHVDTLKWLWDVKSVPPSYVAHRNPQTETDLVDLYKWLMTSGVNGWCDDDSKCAARCGDLSVIQWLHEHKPDTLGQETFDEAAKAGHLHIVQWLHDNRRADGCTSQAWTEAAKHGRLDIVKWLVGNRREGNIRDTMIGAAIGGQLEVLAWLYDNDIDHSIAGVLHAVIHTSDSIECAHNTIQWLASRSEEDDMEDVEQESALMSVPVAALCSGEVHFSRVLWQCCRSSFTVEPIDTVIFGGHLGAIQWLYAEACEKVNWDLALQYARDSGDIEITLCLERVVGNAREEE